MIGVFDIVSQNPPFLRMGNILISGQEIVNNSLVTTKYFKVMWCLRGFLLF